MRASGAFYIAFATRMSRIWSAHHVYNICVVCVGCARDAALRQHVTHAWDAHFWRVYRPFMYCRCRALLARRMCAGPWVTFGQYYCSFSQFKRWCLKGKTLESSPCVYFGGIFNKWYDFSFHKFAPLIKRWPLNGCWWRTWQYLVQFSVLIWRLSLILVLWFSSSTLLVCLGWSCGVATAW
jgi:hypothetical protein